MSLGVLLLFFFLLELNRCEEIAPESLFGNQLLNYQGTFSHNSLPSWYLQPFQREDEKVICLLQQSVNTTGNISADYEHTHSEVKSTSMHLHASSSRRTNEIQPPWLWVCANGRSEWKSSFKYNFSFLIKTHNISQLQQFFNIFPQIKPSPRLQHRTSDLLWISKIIWERQMMVRKSLRELFSINVSVASRKVCLKSLMNHACDFSIKSQVGHRLRETAL